MENKFQHTNFLKTEPILKANPLSKIELLKQSAKEYIVLNTEQAPITGFEEIIYINDNPLTTNKGKIRH